MALTSKKLIRSTKEQIKYLCDYMHSHSNFAAGEFKTSQGSAEYERQWSRLKAALDEIGPHKTVEQWKVCWRDQKRKARMEGGALNKAKSTTGNCAVVPELSENTSLILDTIGQEMAVGCGPEESPIGFRDHPDTCAALTSQPLPPQTSSSTPSTSALLSTLAPPSTPVLPFTPVQPSTSAQRRRVRKSHPPDRFIDAQLEMNSLMKELIKEVRHSNVLRERSNALKLQSNILLEQSNKKQ